MPRNPKTPQPIDPEQLRQAFAKRAFVLFVVVAGLFSVLGARLVWLMIVQYEEYRTQSEDNHRQTVPMVPVRGLIYDRNGHLLADNQPILSIAIVTELVGDLDQTLLDLDALVGLSADERSAFKDRVRRKRRPLEEVPLKTGVTPGQRAIVEINRHRLHGVVISPESVRHYPFDELLAHAVGSVRRISEEDLIDLDARRYRSTRFMGKRGVEAFYEQSLHGEPGFRQVEVDVYGVERGEFSRQRPSPGHDLVLHLDVDLQIAATRALGSRRGAVVAIEPKTGGILALVSNPSYDPNLFVSGLTPPQYQALLDSRDRPLLNRATDGRYAPGSTFKPIVGLAGLALDLTDWERTYADYGEFRLPNQRRVYRSWNWQPGQPGGQGIVNLRQAVFRSSNGYFYNLGSQMEVDALPEFAAQFGYGRVLSLDVADADAGVLPDSDWKRGERGEPWYPGDTVNMAIGQGDLLATPLQVATVASIIANRGLLVPPRMLKSSDGVLAETLAPNTQPGRVEGLAETDWEQMVDAMEDVIHLGNQGYLRNGIAWAHIGRDIGYRLAGKSGTAQVVEIPQGEEYDEELLDEYSRKHAWFMAFAPADDPVIALSAFVENGGGGSSVAGPIVREVVDAYLLGKRPETEDPTPPALASDAPLTPAAAGT
ncbi:MAG: penicillin-binding protein 2 [Gammaproteobacteria bacterium]|nr:penicillin-binding protein 2 [Gammaproteobacteria bacterium]